MSTYFVGGGNIGSALEVQELAKGNREFRLLLKLNVYFDNSVATKQGVDDRGGFSASVQLWHYKRLALEHPSSAERQTAATRFDERSITPLAREIAPRWIGPLRFIRFQMSANPEGIPWHLVLLQQFVQHIAGTAPTRIGFAQHAMIEQFIDIALRGIRQVTENRKQTDMSERLVHSADQEKCPMDLSVD